MISSDRQDRLLKRGNVEVLDSSCVDGVLEKWVVKLKGDIYYLKAALPRNDVQLGSSGIKIVDRETYGCESECISCRIAKMLGIEDVVKYDMDVLQIGDRNIKVCISRDFVEGRFSATFHDLVRVTGNGKEKWQAIGKMFPDLVEKLKKILVLDAIIDNPDRHLGNLRIVKGSECSMPVFDCDAALMSRLPDRALELAFKTSFRYQGCKPFYGTVGNQLELARGVKLKRVDEKEVCAVVDRFLKGERADCVKQLLYRNLQEVGDYCEWY